MALRKYRDYSSSGFSSLPSSQGVNLNAIRSLTFDVIGTPSVVTLCSIVAAPFPDTIKLQRLLELSLLKVNANPKVAFTVMARVYTTNEALQRKSADGPGTPLQSKLRSRVAG